MIIQKNNRQNLFFSIDLEEWWGVESFKSFFKINPVPHDDRIESSVDVILDYLDRMNFHCHFFVLGRVAEKYPDVIKKISDRGHNIGTHGFSHILTYNQDAKEFEADLKMSIRVISQITEKAVISYRAPSYSITKQSLWVLPILVDNGIQFDSSIVPTSNSRFGINGVQEQPFRVILPDNRALIEIPPNTLSWLKWSVPLSSGFAFRLFPSYIIDRTMRRKKKLNNIQPQIILHNWEFDSDHPRLNVPIKNFLIHYLNLKSVNPKLNKILPGWNSIQIGDIPVTTEIRFEEL